MTRGDGSLNPVERRALDAIDYEAMLAFVERLVRVVSLGGAETEAQRAVADELADSGLAVDSWPIDLERLREHPAFSEEIPRTEATGVVGTTGAGAGPSLLMNGHVDVVPTGDPAAWTVPPWQVTRRDGRLYGRGTADMKGGLACAVAAARAIGAAGIELAGTLAIHSVVGEEDGGTGTLATILRGHGADAGVIMEPTRLRIVPVQAGALNFRIRVRGRSAHASVREQGVSVLELLPEILDALGQLEQQRNARVRHPLLRRYRLPIPLSVGRVQAGDWPSSVPDSLTLEGRYGIAPGEAPAAARAELEAAVSGVGGDHPWFCGHPAQVEWWGGRFEAAAIRLDSPIIGALRLATQDACGAEPEIEGVTYGSDLRLLVNEARIPAVLFGPGDVAVAHAPDEFVDEAELRAAARTLTLLAIRFCGVRAISGPA